MCKFARPVGPPSNPELLSEQCLVVTVRGSLPYCHRAIEFCIINTLITVNLFKSVCYSSLFFNFKSQKVPFWVHTSRVWTHIITLAEIQPGVMVLHEKALPLWGVLDEGVNIGVSSMAVLHILLLQGRGCRGLQCQKLAAEPKPHSYPQMNSRRRTVQQAVPSFLNSCHMLDGKNTSEQKRHLR